MHGQVVLPSDPTVDLNPGFRNAIAVTGLFDHNANTVYNELPLAILRGEFLDRDLRERSSGALRAKGNSVGELIQARLQWTGASCWGDRSDWRPLVSIAHHEQSGLSFTADQFDLAFFGNAAFEGLTASLSPSGYEQIRYETVGAGVQHTKGSYLRFDLVRGLSLAAVNVDYASLYTGEDGQVIRSSLLGDYVASDTAGYDLSRTNGLGAAISGRWSFTTRPAEKTRFSIGVEDLGLVAWNERSVAISKDTLIRYEGLRVYDLFALDAVIVNESTVLDTFGLRYDHGSVTRLLPFRVFADVVVPVSEDWRLSVLAEHRHLPGYLPQLTAQGSRVIGRRTMLGAALGYGGFGGLRAGLSMKHRFGEHVLMTLSTPQVPAYFTGRARGVGLFVGIDYGF
ncbi:MAG: hypothetical protein KDB95_13080 [Flavobacteriales bacterium]|nr:hypothetical protein [Flavobacteriales bacterium]